MRKREIYVFILIYLMILEYLGSGSYRNLVFLLMRNGFFFFFRVEFEVRKVVRESFFFRVVFGFKVAVYVYFIFFEILWFGYLGIL